MVQDTKMMVTFFCQMTHQFNSTPLILSSSDRDMTWCQNEIIKIHAPLPPSLPHPHICIPITDCYVPKLVPLLPCSMRPKAICLYFCKIAERNVLILNLMARLPWHDFLGLVFFLCGCSWNISWLSGHTDLTANTMLYRSIIFPDKIIYSPRMLMAQNPYLTNWRSSV